MRQRTLENAQLYHLSTRYDLSRDSRLALAIVRTVDRALDLEEQRRGVRRVRTGELLLCTRRGPLVLPLRTPEALDRVLAGERWAAVRRDILAESETLYRGLFPEAKPRDIEAFLRCVFQGKIPSHHRGPSPLLRPSRQRPWTSAAPDAEPLWELDAERGRKRLDRDPPRPAHRPETVQRLLGYLANEAGIPPAVREPLLLELVALRARFYPRIATLGSGQMPLAGMHVDAGRTLWESTRYQPLAPLVVSVLAGDEAHALRRRPPTSYEDFLAFHGRRMARVLTEAYTQDGLLAFTELRWIFLTSMATVSRAVDYHQRRHRVILPCPGTVLDMGRMLTHKNLIVRRHLQGRTVLEIARQTYHSPHSVDAYLKAFDAVLILHLYGLPPALMAAVLGRGQTLVQEYLELIQTYLKDSETMRGYLRQKGVQLPAQISYGG